MHEAPQAPLAPKEPAPGAKASFHLGLWSVLLNALCGCFPVAIPLGIAAIVKHGKAEKAAQAEPGRFEAPASAGKTLGIVGLCLTVFAFAWIGIVSAVSIPGLLGQRDQMKARMVRMLVAQAQTEAARLAAEKQIQEGRPPTPEEVVEAVLAEPQIQSARNPYHLSHASPFRKGAEPSVDGEVVLHPEPQHFDSDMDRTYPAVVIRGRCRTAGQPQTIEKIVPLD